MGTPVQWAFELAETHSDATRAAFDLRGNLDLASADLLSVILSEQLALGRRYVRLNLAGLNHIDRVGLAALTRTHNTFLAHHGTLILTDLGPKIGELIRTAGLENILLIATGTTESLNSRPR